jgi:hypothetical protein
MRKMTVAVAAIAVVSWGAAFAVGVPTASAISPSYNVYVGYVDSLRAGVNDFPTPFDSGPGVTYKGCAPISSCLFDGGAIRVVNASAVPETLDSLTVRFDVCTFDLWPHGIVIPAGGQLVAAQTASGATNGCVPGTTVGASTMDSSDFGPGGQGWSGNCQNSGIVPDVTVSVDGVSSTYADTGQVLNTGGVDKAICSNGNESEQWVSIGLPPCPTGAVLTLAPPAQTHSVGTNATVIANFSACGSPLQGATVNFSVVSGPDTGLTGSRPVDSSGNATFAYGSALVGTDTVVASVTNAAGTIRSNSVDVTWTAARTSLTSTPPPSVPVGGTMGPDSATLSGGVNPTGTIGFALFAPNDPTCQTPIFFRTDAVAGNGNYSSGPVGTVTVPGTYRWVVAYFGDSNNQGTLSPCGAEQTVVTPQVLTGRAFGLSLVGLVQIKATPDTGAVATTSSSTVAPPCVLRIGTVTSKVRATGLCASVVTSAPYPSSAKAAASIASATITGIPNVPTIVIGAVQSSSATSCAGSSGSATIASLKIGTHTILPSPSPVRPNTTINLGILKIVLNQQISFTGADSGLTVNAIHITAINAAVNLIVASSTSDIGNCP